MKILQIKFKYQVGGWAHDSKFLPTVRFDDLATPHVHINPLMLGISNKNKKQRH